MMESIELQAAEEFSNLGNDNFGELLASFGETISSSGDIKVVLF